MQPKIVFRNVTRRFDLGNSRFVALDRFSLDVEDGEFVTVVGPSGCGKSTALNIAAGLLAPSDGEVSVDGKMVEGPGPERGVIFQQYALFPWLTVRQNVEFGLRMRQVSRAERRRRAMETLDMVRMSAFAARLPFQLSGGQQQRVALARALVIRPAILLMDEPMGALDAFTREQVQEILLEAWAATHKMVFFITHSVEEALFLGTRLVVMSPGPGRITRVYDDLPFSREFLGHRDARRVKSAPEFIRLREEVLALIQRRAPQTADA